MKTIIIICIIAALWIGGAVVERVIYRKIWNKDGSKKIDL